jgi:hypothetical protein
MRNKNSSRPNKVRNSSKKIVSRVIKQIDRQVTRKVYFFGVANGVTGSVTGTLYTPVLPAQGVTSLTRTGDSLFLDEIQYRISLENSTTVDALRIVVLQAKANNVPTLASIFDTGSSGALDVTSFINFYAKNKEFIILKDIHFSVCAQGQNGCQIRAFNIKPSIQTINFTLGGTTAEAGQIYIAVFSTTGILTTYSIEQRVIFHDL